MKIEVSRSLLRGFLPPLRGRNQHKRSFGVLQIVAASKKYPGAGILSALGAFKAGCGFVSLDSEAFKTIVGRLPELVSGFRADADAFVVGPGIEHPRQKKKISAVFKKIDRSKVVLVDGGALRIWKDLNPADDRTWVLTPHEGEMAYLLGFKNARALQKDREGALKRLASEFPRSVILLKGSRTLIASKGRIFEIPWGSVAMATAGQGDLLSGVIGAFLARGMEAGPSAILAASLCAIVGDRLAKGREAQGVLAHEVAEGLPQIIAELRKRRSSIR